MSTFVYVIVFRRWHSWRNILCEQTHKGRWKKVLNSTLVLSKKMGWKEKDQQICGSLHIGVRHPGDDVLQIEVRVSLYEPLESLGRLIGRPKTFRQQVGVQKRENRKYPLLWSGWRKVMMFHVMFRSDWKTYGCNILGLEWESYGWTDCLFTLFFFLFLAIWIVYGPCTKRRTLHGSY